MVRTPSVGSPSGTFLGSGLFDAFGNSSILSTQTSQSGIVSKLDQSEPKTSTSRSGLWGSSSNQSTSGAQWPLGSGASDSTSKSSR